MKINIDDNALKNIVADSIKENLKNITINKELQNTIRQAVIQYLHSLKVEEFIDMLNKCEIKK